MKKHESVSHYHSEMAFPHYHEGLDPSLMHPIDLFDFSDIDDTEEQEQNSAPKPVRTLPKIQACVVSANDVDTLDDCFDTEPPPVFSFDEKIELHKVLLEQSCNELHEAIQIRDYDLMQDILSWFDDKAWRAYSFRVCAAVSDIEPEILLSQIAMHLRKNGIQKELSYA